MPENRNETGHGKSNGLNLAPEERVHDLLARIIELEVQNSELTNRKSELSKTITAFRSLISEAPAPFFTINRYNIIEDVNEASSRLVGVPRESLISQKITSFIAPEEIESYYLYRRDAFRYNHVCSMNINLLCREEKTKIAVDLTSLKAGSGRLLMIALPVSTGDMCSAKPGGQQVANPDTGDRMRGLSLRLLEAQEKEVRHIGQDLHDIVGSSLTVMKLAIHEARKKLPEGLRDVLVPLDEMTIDLAQQVRSLSQSLRSTEIERIGLEEALLSYVQNLENQTGIEISFSCDPLPESIPANIQVTAFRIVQEALNNVVKHAGAQQVSVALVCEAGNLVVKVADAGKGFDVSSLPENGGISGMMDRAVLAGGSLKVDSAHGRGTRIIGAFPLK